MITVLHGDNTVVSRQALNNIISSFKGEIITLDGKSLDVTDFAQVSRSGAMFEQKRLVIIENFFSFNKKSRLDFAQIDSDLIFYESKKLSPTSIPIIKDARIQEYKADPIIFKLVDNIRPGNGKNLILVYRQCLKTSEPEFIFAMIIRQLRLTKLFPPDKLKLLYEKLLDLDYKNKTGQLIGSFKSNLEMFIFNI